MSVQRKGPFCPSSDGLTIDQDFGDLGGGSMTCSGSTESCKKDSDLEKRCPEQGNSESSDRQEDDGQEIKPLHYKVLVVDDEEPMRKLIITLLSKQGHQCITACNGVEALNKIRENKVDAVITDVVMPEMDGIALTKEILNLFPYLPVMVITGYGKEYSTASALAAGAREFIEKPFSAEEFLLRLAKMMRDYEMICQLKVKQNQMVFHLSRRNLEEVNALNREIESLKLRLISAYTESL